MRFCDDQSLEFLISQVAPIQKVYASTVPRIEKSFPDTGFELLDRLSLPGITEEESGKYALAVVHEEDSLWHSLALIADPKGYQDKSWEQQKSVAENLREHLISCCGGQLPAVEIFRTNFLGKDLLKWLANYFGANLVILRSGRQPEVLSAGPFLNQSRPFVVLVQTLRGTCRPLGKNGEYFLLKSEHPALFAGLLNK
ncbi:MAG: hypothetical protein ACYCOU_05740 [Sulfobacillus sp.]